MLKILHPVCSLRRTLTIFSIIGIATISATIEARSFMLGAYVPYWKCEKATHTMKQYSQHFDQMSPFSFEINSNGSILNKFRRTAPYWHDLQAHCKKHGILFVPTIYWTNTEDMHNVLSDKKKRDFHIQSIMDTVINNGYDGININYERVCSHDRASYLAFMRALSEKLHARKLVLHTSIGGRTGDRTIALVYPGDRPPTPAPKPKHTPLKDHALKKPRLSHISLNPGTGAEALEYKKTIAQYCDQIHFMGYDEWGKPYLKDDTHFKNEYFLSHSSNQWLEQIIQYALTFIPPEKIVLALPTYGLEFALLSKNEEPSKKNLSVKKRRSLLYPTARDTAQTHHKKPHRTHGGELSYIYNNHGEKRYVCYLDGDCVREKIEIAKKYRIKGIYLFTITGNEDPSMWDHIARESCFSCLK